MARKSKKKKKSINWKSVVWTLLAVNVLLGLLYSPMTSVRRIRIIGVQPHDEDRVRSLAQSLSGKPFARVGATQLESSMLQQRDVFNAKLTHNLFGSATVRLQYREPVAVMKDMPRTYLDRQGVIFGSPEKMPELRQISLAPEYVEPGVALTLPWPSQSVAELCKKLDAFEQLKDAAVHLDTTGRLLIHRNDSHTVDLGGTGQLDMKLNKLRELLDGDPQLLDKYRSLSLADPNRPATKTN